MGALCVTGRAAPPVGGTEERERNKRISKDQNKHQRQGEMQIKLLLLGTGDSGKTTLRKQLKNVYGDGFGEASRRQLAPVVITNLLDGYRDVLKAMQSEKFQLKLDNSISQDAAQLIVQSTGPMTHLSMDLAKACTTLYEDDGFAACLQRKSEYNLQDCWAAYSQEIRNFPAWGGEGWIPSTNDCVIARVRTSGIIEEVFTVDGVQFRLFDVGGQRNERRKWIHSFDNVSTIIFVTALSEYDLHLYEDETKNRLEESLELFEEIVNSKWFVTTPVLLFLNKRDLFEKKYVEERIPINVSGCFPDAPDLGDGTPDIKLGIDYLTRLFEKRKRTPEKELYTYVTTGKLVRVTIMHFRN